MFEKLLNKNFKPLDESSIEQEKFIVNDARTYVDATNTIPIDDAPELNFWQENFQQKPLREFNKNDFSGKNSILSKIAFREPNSDIRQFSEKVKAPNNYSEANKYLPTVEKKVHDLRNVKNVNMRNYGVELVKLEKPMVLNLGGDVYENIKPYLSNIFDGVNSVFPKAEKIILRSALVRNIVKDSNDKGIGSAHSDFTCSSGAQCRNSLIEKGLLKEGQKYIFINAWMHVNQKSQTSTLAFMPGKYAKAADMGVIEVKSQEFKNSSYRLKNSSNHFWGYFHNLDIDELVVFKQFDSEKAEVYQNHNDVTYHSAVRLSEGADIRSSMELRFIITFD
ncbi:CmcJ/NvfI family oxidoreductase [Francisella sp. 19X1-34]|uniref:CmcJ/NvfI family oxidoreductase n=1 Tax=Francisella sp. 19X1-34 TaxID=3087177 RepID=UPI002E334D43|nr:CmcJ/NvfI family oxidoreductase [Francisella sp. 19X1-34]MED7787988.1 CmcJ/NvfI family oxidoreductase [Francisella sp. 19X1-34]